MGALEPGHLVVILAIVLIIFGPGKMSSIGGDLGKAVREFRHASEAMNEPAPVPASVTRTCASCATANASDAKFCVHCGAGFATALSA